jgi:endonuclease YncB( thermonuclease family)
MGFTLIKGTFHVLNAAPDGDTIHFRANNADHWTRLAGPAVRLTRERRVKLRLEGIDALETHYGVAHAGEYRQPFRFGEAARDALLDSLGITGVVWEGGVIVAANHAVPGFILTREAEKNRRSVAFVYAGHTRRRDGDDVFLDRAMLRDSVNYRLLAAGLVFPLFYAGLFHDLREEFTAAVLDARARGAGLWPRDRTTEGAAVDSVRDLTDTIVMLPKLFRRLITYMAPDGAVDGFKRWLASYPDPVTRLRDVHRTHLDDEVEVVGKWVRLKTPPEGLIFEG